MLYMLCSICNQLGVVLIENESPADNFQVENLAKIVLVNFRHSNNDPFFRQMLTIPKNYMPHITDTQPIYHDIFYVYQGTNLYLAICNFDTLVGDGKKNLFRWIAHVLSQMRILHHVTIGSTEGNGIFGTGQT